MNIPGKREHLSLWVVRKCQSCIELVQANLFKQKLKTWNYLGIPNEAKQAYGQGLTTYENLLNSRHGGAGCVPNDTSIGAGFIMLCV